MVTATMYVTAPAIVRSCLQQALRYTFAARTKEFKAERAKCQDLGAELLTLVRRRWPRGHNLYRQTEACCVCGVNDVWGVLTGESQRRFRGPAPEWRWRWRWRAVVDKSNRVGHSPGSRTLTGLNADLQRETEAHRDNVSRLVRQYALSNVNANVIAELAETHAAQERRLRMQVLCTIPRPMKCDS